MQADKNQVWIVNKGCCWCMWPCDQHIFTLLAGTSGLSLWNPPPKNLLFLGDVNISNLKWRTLHGGGIRYCPQWIRAVRFPPTWFIFPPDMVFSQCPQDNKVTKPTELDGITWHETSIFSVSVSRFPLNNKLKPWIQGWHQTDVGTWKYLMWQCLWRSKKESFTLTFTLRVTLESPLHHDWAVTTFWWNHYIKMYNQSHIYYHLSVMI